MNMMENFSVTYFFPEEMGIKPVTIYGEMSIPSKGDNVYIRDFELRGNYNEISNPWTVERVDWGITHGNFSYPTTRRAEIFLIQKNVQENGIDL